MGLPQKDSTYLIESLPMFVLIFHMTTELFKLYYRITVCQKSRPNFKFTPNDKMDIFNFMVSWYIFGVCKIAI
jgi:hypothetical protein